MGFTDRGADDEAYRSALKTKEMIHMFMKKLFSFLLAISLAVVPFAAAFAEQTGSLAGTWRISAGAGMDVIDTLVFHEDGSMEAYAIPDVYNPAGKGLLLFSGACQLNGAELTLANGETYRMEERTVTEEDDFPISLSLYTAEKGDILLSLARDEEFGFYVKGYSCPGIPAEEELFGKVWKLDGQTFAFDESMIENGRLLLNGKAYSLQYKVLPIPEEMTEEELDKLGEAEKLLSESTESEERTLYLSENELIAYPLAEGEALVFTAGDQ